MNPPKHFLPYSIAIRSMLSTTPVPPTTPKLPLIPVLPMTPNDPSSHTPLCSFLCSDGFSHRLLGRCPLLKLAVFVLFLRLPRDVLLPGVLAPPQVAVDVEHFTACPSTRPWETIYQYHYIIGRGTKWRKYMEACTYLFSCTYLQKSMHVSM